MAFGRERSSAGGPRAMAKGGVLLAGLLAASGCYIDTQRHPNPMYFEGDLPEGSQFQYAEGPEEVLIVRHSDPVALRPPGEAQSFPLTFYRKTTRTNAGSWVSCGAGGRLEVLWPNGTSIVLFGAGAGVVGSPSVGEPTFLFKTVDRATLHMKEGDRVELIGGSILIAESGPFVLEKAHDEILRVRNRSKSVGRLAFRDEVFDLDPGHVVDLPLLSAGAQPFQSDPGFQVLGPPAAEVEVRGDVEVSEDARGGATRVRATGEQELRALGLRIRLDPGDEAVFAPLGSEAPESPPEPPALAPTTPNNEEENDV